MSRSYGTQQHYSIPNYQEIHDQTSFIPTQQPPQPPGIHPLSAATEPGSILTARRQTEEATKSEQGLGEPGYIPDAALNLDFEALFYEHKSNATFSGLYKAIGLIYTYTKILLYHILVIVLGILFAFLWALLSAVTAFVHVWIYQPLMKIIIFWVYALAPLVSAPIQAVFTPLVDVSARIFRQIRIKATLDGNTLVGHSQA